MSQEPTEDTDGFHQISFQIRDNVYQKLVEAMNLAGETNIEKFIWSCVDKHVTQIYDSYDGYTFSTTYTVTLEVEAYKTPYIDNAFKLGLSQRQKVARPELKILQGGQSK